jgi:hypothetical protein
LNEDFRDVLAEFVTGGVRFLVVGAHALAVHGIPRATGDLDLWVEPSGENAERALAALVRFGAPVESLGITGRDLSTPGMVVQIGLPPRRIDVLTSISGVSFADAWATRVGYEVDGLDVPFIGREALIRNKRATGRAKDLADLEALGHRFDDEVP